jgi:hypothetical protein
MKLSNYTRIISNDYPTDDQELVERLGGQVNDGMDQLFFAVGGRLTFADNFLCTQKEIEITVRSTGVPTTRTSITLANSNTVIGCLVISAINKTNTTAFPTSTPFISFTQNGTSLFIDNVTGLTSENRYLVKFICFN